MPTYRLEVAYDGTGFHGYARQPARRTVQGELEAALSKHVPGVVTSVAGRTDRGVHATGQVVSFSTDDVLDTERVLRSLNRQLGDEIAVTGITLEGDDFHARFSATSRAYRYRVLNRAIHDPLLARTVWHVAEALDIDTMNQGAALLVGEHDFTSFCRRADESSLVRRVLWAEWQRHDDLIEFSIGANAFCHQMVRSIVMALVDVGRGRLQPNDVKLILDARDRQGSRGVAPPQGLTLVQVGYAEDTSTP